MDSAAIFRDSTCYVPTHDWSYWPRLSRQESEHHTFSIKLGLHLMRGPQEERKRDVELTAPRHPQIRFL